MHTIETVRRSSSFFRRAMLGLALVLAPGCAVNLKDKPVRSLKAALHQTSKPELCPGQAWPVVVTAELAGGEQLVTEGAGGGKVSWDSFKIETVKGGHLAEKGVFVLAKDPRETYGSPAMLRLSPLGSPAAAADLSIAARYDCDYSEDLRGAAGSGGRSGRSGEAGPDGRSGDKAQPSGGNGRSGTAGGNGSNGDHGAPGPDVEVTVALFPNAERPLLKVRVNAMGHKPRIHLVDPAGGGLTLKANGGDGGAGGAGGAGGRGGNGGAAAKGGVAGSGGDGSDGGDGGNGGNGGRGGRFVVIASPEVRPYLHALKLENAGGAAGAAGEGGMGGDGGSGSSAGRAGRSGRTGQAGVSGRHGPPVEFRELEPAQVAEMVW